MSTGSLTLVSHALCPYVQRAAIVLMEKNAAFKRLWVDLAQKPAWFLAVSPLGKTPVLLVDEAAIFESAAICEYLDEAVAPCLHPSDVLERARHRAWMEFGSSVLDTIAAFYNAKDETALDAHRALLRQRFEHLETVVGIGPYFAGTRFSLVDAVFGPVFRYFDVIDTFGDWRLFDGLPNVQSWRTELAVRPSVRGAVDVDYPTRLQRFIESRPSVLGRKAARVLPRGAL
jgi:glutathione S-transferase